MKGLGVIVGRFGAAFGRIARAPQIARLNWSADRLNFFIVAREPRVRAPHPEALEITHAGVLSVCRYAGEDRAGTGTRASIFCKLCEVRPNGLFRPIVVRSGSVYYGLELHLSEHSSLFLFIW